MVVIKEATGIKSTSPAVEVESDGEEPSELGAAVRVLPGIKEEHKIAHDGRKFTEGDKGVVGRCVFGRTLGQRHVPVRDDAARAPKGHGGAVRKQGQPRRRRKVRVGNSNKTS